MTPSGIGERLRNARQTRGLSLEEIEAGTRIRRRYLEALEAEAFDEVPGPAYVKGFLRTYATYLGLSPDDLVALYPELASGTIIHPGSSIEVRITPVTPHSRTRRIVMGIVLVVALGGGLLAYTLYRQIRQFAVTPPPVSSENRSPAATPSRPGGTEGVRPAPGAAPRLPAGAPAITSPPSPGTAAAPKPPPVAPPGAAPKPAGAPPASSPAATPKPTGVPPAGPATPPPQSAPVGSTVLTAPLHVVVVATDRSWVKAVADGVTVYEGFLSAGAREDWEARREISLKVGNASGLTVTVNGHVVGLLGKPGDVVDRTFTVGGSVSP